MNDSGEVVGGIRAKGPLESADDSHAVVEWEDRPGLRTVRKMLTDRLPFGVVEMKTAWVSDDPDRARIAGQSLWRALRFPPWRCWTLSSSWRQPDHTFSIAGARSGGVVASKIPATPYPDDRYRTKMMWWDRSTFANHADPEQVSKIFNEMAILARRLDHGGARATRERPVTPAGGDQCSATVLVEAEPHDRQVLSELQCRPHDRIH